MDYKYLDMSTYARRAHFDYFRTLAYPYVGVTVHVDITDLVRKAKEEELPFFLSLCYCVAQAANAVPEFRQRIHGDGIIQYDWCQTSHTVALEDGTYCYCVLDSRRPFRTYLPEAIRRQEEAKVCRTIEDGEDALALLFVSSLPWLSYEAIVQPTPYPADSNPRITWGKAETRGGQVVIPLTLLCHHALADGLHLARFYQCLEEELAQFPGDQP